MKKLFVLIGWILVTASSFAQSPQAFKYQAIARDNSGEVLINQLVSLKISLLQDAIDGTSVYVETYNTTSNDFGLINLEIGNGIPESGDFSTIDWGSHSYFVKIEMDETGGTNYQFMDISKLLSVPYALYAGKTGVTTLTGHSATELDDITGTGSGAIITDTERTNFTIAYNWGDHASSGYLTSYTETDPKIGTNTTNYLSKWNGTALVSSTIFDNGNIGIGTNDPGEVLDVNGAIRISTTNNLNAGTIRFNNDVFQGYNGTEWLQLSGGSETPWITSGSDIYYNSGNVGINITSPTTELDVNGIITATGGNSTNWNTAYGWGEHSIAGYLTSYTETDPVFGASTAGGITEADTANWNNKLDSEVDGSVTNEIQNLNSVLAQGTDADNLNITNLAEPVNNQDAATKAYVDALEARLNVLEARVSALEPPTPTVQQRLDEGETPYQIYQSDNSLLDSLYGKSYEGGLIFYLNTSDGSGFVSASSDQSTDARWGCYGTEISGADGTVVGTGAQNTIDIEAGCTTAGTAADICANLSLNSYSDWFLPSRNELNLMYTNLYLNGLGGFASFNYWSSTESNYDYAWRQNFGFGSQLNTNKYRPIYVRAGRAFLGPRTVQQRLDVGETPYQIYQSDNSLLDSLYGKSYAGGLIFYLNTSDGSGFVSASSDQSTGAEWGCYETTINGADGTAIGTGEQNTLDIEAGCTTSGTAADLCANLTLNGYSDWFLPSKDELNAMYTNLHQKGFGGFASFYYWSSSEYSNILYAWIQNFLTGRQISSSKSSTSPLYVRAVRAF